MSDVKKKTKNKVKKKTISIWKLGKTKWLNPKQEKFCQLYVNWTREFFGNWTQCYIEAYEPNTSKPARYKTARSTASTMLTNVNLINRINELLEEWWLNDQNIDKQLLFIISQYSDLWNKLWAIKEYNKLKNRIESKLKVEITESIKVSDLFDRKE